VSGGKQTRKRSFVYIDPRQVTLDTKLRELLATFRKRDWEKLADCTACNDRYPEKLTKFTGKYCVACFVEREYHVIPQGTVSICGSAHRPTRDHGAIYDGALRRYEDANGSQDTPPPKAL
jgi:hypothetical protein